MGENFVSHTDIITANTIGEEHLYKTTQSFLKEIWPSRELKASLRKLEAMVPLKIDLGPENVVDAMWNPHRTLDFLLPKMEVDGVSRGSVDGQAAHIFIVTESWFTNEESLCFSEKILRPMLFKMPFLLMGSPNGLTYLKTLGFKTFNPYIDESYDTINDPIKRIKAIFKEIERLGKLSDSQLEDLEEKTKEICEHNYSLIFDQKHWHNTVNKELYEINNKMKEHGMLFLQEDTFVNKITRYHGRGLNFIKRVKRKVSKIKI